MQDSKNYHHHPDASQASKNYEVVAELGHGAQGSVYLVREERTSEMFAAKVYDKSDRLSLEERILRKVRGAKGFPQIEDTTEIDEQNVVIMQLLGDNLRTLKDKCKDQHFSLQTSLQILYQMIQQLETLHKLGFVHCDIKPDNMLIASETDLYFKNDTNIYLVDFGLAHSYLDRNGYHMRQPSKVSFKGTISYCSLNLLDKQFPSRRDDLESLIYVVLFLFFGQLPWHKKAQTMAGRERLDYVIRMKQAMPIESYGPEIPECILSCYRHVRELEYEEEPNYELMKSLVLHDLCQFSPSHQIGIFDWSRPSIREQTLQAVELRPQLGASQLEAAKQQFTPCNNQWQQLGNDMQFPTQNVDAKVTILKERKSEKPKISRELNESLCMEAEYQDFMSIELDEGDIEISLHGLEARNNQLSSLSPFSPNSMKDSDESFSESKKGTKVGNGPLITSSNVSPMGLHQGQDFSSNLKLNLLPFDFAEDGEFDVLQMQQGVDMIKTARKQSSMQPSRLDLMEAIRKDRKFSMQCPY